MRGAVVFLVLGLLAAGCDGGGGETTTAAIALPSTAASTTVPVVVPTPEELAARLLTAEDLDGAWTAAPELLPPGMSGGVATAAVREQLPRLEVCSEAGPEAAAAAAAVEWLAFTFLETPGAERSIFLGQGLAAGDPDQIEAVFATLKEATADCVGSEPVSESGQTQVTESIPIPEVGEDRVGVRVTITDDGFRDYLWFAFVRDGTVLLFLNLWEGTAANTVITADQVDAIITTAASRLP